MTPKLPKINFAADAPKLEGASIVKQEQFIARPRSEVFEFRCEMPEFEFSRPR
ncbi:MAG: hypothetical protein JHC98_10500 [Thermoleophilaceae bacterium]|nr:hypothetical protein [Thermoleophilaceae bacterium]